MRPHVSYSEISSFANDCQFKWKLDYLDGLRSEKFSVHFDFGHAVHEALEKYLTRKNPITLNEAELVFRTSFKDLYDKNSPKYGKPEKFDDMLAAGTRIIQSIDDLMKVEELIEPEVVYNEFALFEDIERDDDVKVKFKGFIDIVIKAKDKRGNSILWVADFKTCSWGWDRDTRDDRWKHYQVFLYKYFLCKKFDIDPKNVRTAFILLKKRPPKNSSPIEFFAVSAGPVSVQRALDTLGSIVTEMTERSKSGEFVKNRKCCVDKYGNQCPFFKTAQCPE